MPIDKNVSVDYRKPKNSIPVDGETIVKTLIYDIDYTKSAKERAKAEGRPPVLQDGIAVKFVHLDYWDKNNNHKQLVQWDGATSAADIKFPCDLQTSSEGTDYMYITNEEYLNIARVTNKSGIYGNFVKPTNEADCLRVFDQSFAVQFGLQGGELADAILNFGIANVTEEELARVGIIKPSKTEYLVLNCYRYLDKYETKDGKKEMKWSLTGYNRSLKKMDLGGSVEWIPEQVGLAIFEAVVARADAKKNGSTTLTDSPF